MPDLARIQSIVVARPPERSAAILVLRFGAVEGARTLLGWILDRTPAASGGAVRGAAVMHPSLTWSGIAQLARDLDGLDPATGAEALEPWFVAPLPTHPVELGFVGESAPDLWWEGRWSSADADMTVHVLAADDDALDLAVAALRAEAERNGVAELSLAGFAGGALRGRVPSDGVLHFGYRDGITRPAIDWAGEGSAPVDFREILLGYPSEDYPISPVAPGPWQDFVRDGTIGCILWIEQHVHAFEQFLDDTVAAVRGVAPEGLEREWIASRILGRWRNGSPVTRWPDEPPAAADTDDAFGFADDPDGARCPLAAHIRLVNPRDDRLTPPLRAKFPKGPPRLIRRGFAYGPPIAGPAPDGVPRGLVGVFFGARLNEQHRSVLRWMQATTINDRFGRAPYSGTMQDGLCGVRGKPGADPRHVLPREGGAVEMRLRDFITFRGALHVLTASLPSLERLATGR
ncbi:MAG TPA: hypothetical protein PKA33_14810 [Amaricoccus sp.]|uniref:hypothetical protein n=1 Tax=Amaricoccus sp. TaxID=1872485 RepID=UPI002CB47757|nr:hypothetical protein [Amaricoccus sp.]HMQ93798.1 hypothetical protein [Amaricoccus sp.]HMR53520.1 hypothetical protein [Amaricoccus sp.]HMR60824.1 hypothetical protein [Amaricoccus sp.]HMU00620.1 hypothetical protein [Amaricoccus sp.]